MAVRLTRMIMLTFGVLMASGCQGTHGSPTKKTTITPRVGTPVALESTAPAPPVTDPSGMGDEVKKQLSTCLFEAAQLTRMDAAKYRQPVESLYQNIRAAKYYATLAGRVSDTTADTLTPMYQFRVNDACNTVSQLLYAALKGTPSGTGDNR